MNNGGVFLAVEVNIDFLGEINPIDGKIWRESKYFRESIDKTSAIIVLCKKVSDFAYDTLETSQSDIAAMSEIFFGSNFLNWDAYVSILQSPKYLQSEL